MGSKMSSSHHLVEAECEEVDWKSRKKSLCSVSSAMEGSKASDGCDSVDGNSTSLSRTSAGLSHDFGEDYAGLGDEEEPAFDINENFDFDSDRLTVDSDMMTMDSICDGFDVVELGDRRDVGIGKRQRPSRAALLAGDKSNDKNKSPDKIKSSTTDSKVPNGDITYSLQQLHKGNIKSAIQPVVYKMDYPSRVSNEDFSKDDCLLFIAMSHGEEGVLYCKDGTVSVDELSFRFKGVMCPSLVGKPKLFFIQACRGTQMDHGIRTRAVEGDDEPDAAIEQKMFYTIPVEADFLMAYSSTPGYYSWRSLREGSWFIQAIISVFDKYGTCMDVNQMMTRVNRTVAYRYESISSDERYHGRKQMPCFVSTLTKELYFIPKK